MLSIEKKKVNEFSGQKHRLSDLNISEVSLVTTPAILSDDEANNGVGALIVKFGNTRPVRKGKLPAHLEKSLTIGDDQELSDVIDMLAQAARTHLAVKTANPDMHWTDLISVKGDEVMLSDWWTDVTFSIPFEQQADGTFVFGDPVQVELQWVSVAQSDHEDGEVEMSKLIKFALGDHIVEAPVVAGGELKIGEAVVKVNAAGELELGEGLAMGDDGIVRLVASEKPAPTEADVEKADKPDVVQKENTPVKTDADKKTGDVVDTTTQSVLRQALDMVKEAREMGLQVAKFNVKNGEVDLEFTPTAVKPEATVAKSVEVPSVEEEVREAQAAAGNTVVAGDPPAEKPEDAGTVDITKGLTPSSGGPLSRFFASNGVMQ